MAKTKAMAMCVQVRSPALRSQDGAASQGSSPKGSPRSVVGDYGLENVPVEWDNHPAIRERIRDEKNLCLSYDFEKREAVSKYVEPTIENLKINEAVLMPLAKIMSHHDLQLPAIEKLIHAVAEFFQLAKLSRTSDQCYQEAWALRRMIGKLKRFAYRSTAPQDFSSRKQTSNQSSLHVCWVDCFRQLCQKHQPCSVIRFCCGDNPKMIPGMCQNTLCQNLKEVLSIYKIHSVHKWLLSPPMSFQCDVLQDESIQSLVEALGFNLQEGMGAA